MITDTITEEARDLIRQMQGEIERLTKQLVKSKAFISEVADCQNSDNVNIKRARELRDQLN